MKRRKAEQTETAPLEITDSPAGRFLSRQTEEQRGRLEEYWAEHVESQTRKIQALSVLQLGNDEWNTLATLREEFAGARAIDDLEAQLRLIELGVEILFPDRADSWVDADALDTPPDVARAVSHERALFFDRYFAAKNASGLKTQREVAEAARISPATVQAIEARRVKPQFRTIQKLAKAFGVEVSALLGDEKSAA